MAWAALSDAYYGVYCLMIAILYVAATLIRVTRSAPATGLRPWTWMLDVLIVCLAGLIVGLARRAWRPVHAARRFDHVREVSTTRCWH